MVPQNLWQNTWGIPVSNIGEGQICRFYFSFAPFAPLSFDPRCCDTTKCVLDGHDGMFRIIIEAMYLQLEQ